MTSRTITCALAGCFMLGTTGCESGSGPASAARSFIREYETKVRPVENDLSRAWWNANVSGNDEDYKVKEQTQNKLDALLSDSAQFGRLEKIRRDLAAGSEKPDALLVRQVEVLYLAYKAKQLDAALLMRISALENEVERKFNVFRAQVDGREMTDSEVMKVLKTSQDSEQRRKVWEASKAVGSAVVADLRAVVRLRNEAAVKLGFRDYFEMQLTLAEQEPAEVLRLFDELYELTREPFAKVKAEIDARLAANCGITVPDLRPWHYQDRFFQESPAIDDVDLDTCYATVDIAALTRDFYASFGLPVDGILARSDLYEKPGKCPHGFCCDVDREGDVRILENIVPRLDWMATTLHECGHAVYAAPNIPTSLPYVLRTPAHSFTTEGVAMMIEQFSTRADWMEAMGLKVADRNAAREAGTAMRRRALLIFAAWSQVMVRFEAAMYQNPDQDLNRLWWNLVEKYQRIKRPAGRNAPDYASKIHICTNPCYYHNYTMGQLFASQLHATISREVLKTDPATALYNHRKDVGEFLKKRVFAPGASMRWPEFVRFATGEALSAKAFAAETR